MIEKNNTDLEKITLTDNVLKGYRHIGRTNKRAILFVHGFTGNWDDTWKANKAVAFPDLIFHDPEFVDFDVFIFQYRSTWFKASPIQNIAMQLRSQIDYLRSSAQTVNSNYEIVIL